MTATAVVAVNRFPRPEFQSGYAQPETTFPAARAELFSYVDVLMLAAALLAAAWLVLKARSRRGVFWLSLACLAYFGFYRLGCICPVGSVQNVVLAASSRSFILPVAVGVFFGLPLLAALLFGRVFCAAVCPLGAIQDLVVRKPVRVPSTLSAVLGLLPHVYLGAAVLFTVTGAGFIICRFDPFVSLFRLSGSVGMLAFGIGLLVLGVFVARPYCRYLCPYGVLLGWASMLSRCHATITPDTCIKCRLCEDSCPFGAIQVPTAAPVGEDRIRSLRRVKVLIGLVPVWMVLGAIAGVQSGGVLAKVHHVVRLAEQLQSEESGTADSLTVETETFRAGTLPVSAALEDADRVRGSVRRGAALLGIYLGAVVGMTLVRLSLQRTREDYTPDTQTCLSCGRCFRACPQEHSRLKKRAASSDAARAQEQHDTAY